MPCSTSQTAHAALLPSPHPPANPALYNRFGECYAAATYDTYNTSFAEGRTLLKASPLPSRHRRHTYSRHTEDTSPHLAVEDSPLKPAALVVPPLRRAVVEHALRVLEAHPALPRPANHRGQRRPSLPLRLPGDQAHSRYLGHPRGEAVAGEKERSDLRRDGLDELWACP